MPSTEEVNVQALAHIMPAAPQNDQPPILVGLLRCWRHWWRYTVVGRVLHVMGPKEEATVGRLLAFTPPQTTSMANTRRTIIHFPVPTAIAGPFERGFIRRALMGARETKRDHLKKRDRKIF